MKSLLSLVVLAGVLLVGQFKAQAQFVRYSLVPTSLNGGTNNIASGTTNSAAAIPVNCLLSTIVGLQPSFKLVGAGTSAVVFRFDRSLDNSVWDASAYSVSVTANGTNVVSTVGSVTNGPIGYLRLQIIENPNGTAITNLVFKYSLKNGL